jgi:hypothetical protein
MDLVKRGLCPSPRSHTLTFPVPVMIGCNPCHISAWLPLRLQDGSLWLSGGAILHAQLCKEHECSHLNALLPEESIQSFIP